MQFQTELLDALYEGYSIIEFQFGDGNTAETFRLCKVTDNWDTVIATPTISNGKATYTFPANALTLYNLGVAILNIGDSGKKMVLNKVIMRMPTSYTLTVNDGDYGTVSVSPYSADGKYPEGTEVTVTATPADGWYFDQWSDGNKLNPRTVTVSADLEITAQYTDQKPNYLWTGTATCNSWGDNPTATLDFKGQTYEVGDKLVFKAEKRDGAGLNIAFDNWNYKADGDGGRPKPTETADGYELTLNQEMVNALNSNKTIIFNGNNVTIYQVDLVKAVSYTINVASADAAQGSVEIVDKTGTSFTGSGTVQLKATPATGYKFASWTTPTGTSTDNPLSVTLSESVDGKTYTANFAEATKYNITVTAGENGSVNTTGGEYYEGNEVTFTATPADGYRVARWTKNGVTIDGETKNTLTITVSGNDAYGVEFEEKPAVTEVVIWSVGQDFTGWYGQLNISNSNLQNKDQIGSQTTMKLYFASEFHSDNVDCNIYIGGWGNNASSFRVASDAASTGVSIPLSATQITALKTGDLTVVLQIKNNNGNATLQKISLE